MDDLLINSNIGRSADHALLKKSLIYYDKLCDMKEYILQVDDWISNNYPHAKDASEDAITLMFSGGRSSRFARRYFGYIILRYSSMRENLDRHFSCDIPEPYLVLRRSYIIFLWSFFDLEGSEDAISKIENLDSLWWSSEYSGEKSERYKYVSNLVAQKIHKKESSDNKMMSWIFWGGLLVVVFIYHAINS